MDVCKQYIVQCIVIAANNLRLSSEKIEVVALLREFLNDSSNIDEDIIAMKKNTHLSKLAIKLGESYHYISKSKIDFLRLSDKFKEQSYSIVKELSNLLDLLTTKELKETLNQIRSKDVNIDLTKIKSNPEILDKQIAPTQAETKSEPKLKSQLVETQKLKEDFILAQDEEDELDFDDFVKLVLKPIKEIDSLLKKIESKNYKVDEIIETMQLVEKNGEIAAKIGFEIISEMHNTFAKGLKNLAEEKLTPTYDFIESMRACLIVIVAVIKDKDVDITNYLKKAQAFAKNI